MKGDRLLRNEEVVGSNPITSTPESACFRVLPPFFLISFRAAAYEAFPPAAQPSSGASRVGRSRRLERP